MWKTNALLLALMLPGTLLADDYRSSVVVDPGGTLEVRISSGSVEIDSHDDREVVVEAVLDGVGSFDLDLESDGRDALLTGSTRNVWQFFAPEVRIQVRVPSRYSVDVQTGGGSVEIQDLLGDVLVETAVGEIEVDDVDGDVELETSGGGIRVDDVTGSLRASTSGGSVEVTDVGGEVDVRTSGGRISIRDVRGPVYAETSGGPIDVRFRDAPEGIIRTSGGPIDVEFAEGRGAALDASTSGGHVRLDSDLIFKGRSGQSSIVGELNGGGEPLVLHTSGGNVRVKAR